jgi:8-oxo-dGTP diphosphatase
VNPFRLVVVVHVLLIKDNQLLLMRRCNTGREDGKYGPPGGCLDGGEELQTAAIREMKEECGVDIVPEDLTMVGVMHINDGNERIHFFFLAERWSGEISNAEPHKCDDIRWFPMDNLPVDLIPFIGQALDQYRQGIWFSGYGWNLLQNGAF